MLACYHGHTAMVNYLIESKSPLDAVGDVIFYFISFLFIIFLLLLNNILNYFSTTKKRMESLL